MITILREYDQGGKHITEYTKDGKNVSHTVVSDIVELSSTQPPTLESRVKATEDAIAALMGV